MLCYLIKFNLYNFIIYISSSKRQHLAFKFVELTFNRLFINERSKVNLKEMGLRSIERGPNYKKTRALPTEL